MLSEVLITLVIIGVVAAITMPIMVADWQKNATVERLKKAYSTLSNAVALSVADNGLGYNWDVPNEKTYQVNKKFAETYLTPYLNVGQICEYGKDDVCNYEYSSKTKYSNLGFPNVPFYQLDNYNAFALADGSTYRVSGSGIFKNGNGSISMLVDINGNKKPNRLGRDIFVFNIAETSRGTLEFLPMGYSSYSNLNREELIELCKSYSSTCSNLLMNDSWEIKEDYPW